LFFILHVNGIPSPIKESLEESIDYNENHKEETMIIIRIVKINLIKL